MRLLPDTFRCAIAREGPLARAAIAAFFVAAVIYGGGKGDGGNGGGGDGGDPGGGGDRGGVLHIPRPGGTGVVPSVTAGATNEVFRWTAFSIDGDRFGGAFAWPATNLDDYAAIDIFHKASLTNALWRWIHREEVYYPEDLEASVTFNGDELPYWEEKRSWNFREYTNEIVAPFGVTYTNILAYVPAATNLAAGFFRAANQHDSDGDGAPDAVETSLGLDPGDPDMDGDGVPDGRELALGASPLLTDSDGDGLDDGVEVSWGAASTNGAALWIDTSAATNRVVIFTDTDDGCAELPMPFPLRLVGAAMTNLAVNANGLVGFSSGAAAFGSGCYNNYRAEYLPLSNIPCATIAAFWDDLQVFQEMGSAISLVVVGADGGRTGVVEFAHVGFHNCGTNDFVSLQVQFSELETNVVRVVFSEASGRGCGSSATLGALSTGDCGVEYSFNDDGSVFPGLAIEYHVGIGTSPAKTDTDDDGLGDAEELILGTNPHDSDTDGDGLDDGWEIFAGTNPFNSDTDNDGLPDDWEMANGTNPLDSSDGQSDIDGDGLVFADEVLTHLTNPELWDTDGDDISDGQEILIGTNPSSFDTDGDGLPDDWEIDNSLDPLDATDGTVDSDNDGLSNADEFLNGADPQAPDTDGDDVADGIEVTQGSDPCHAGDGGTAPEADALLPLPFHVYGDYAAWEMRIHATEGDTRTFRISTSVPGQTGARILKLRKGASYEISLRWRGDGDHEDHEWYCWEAQIGDPLSPSSRCFNDYSPTRLEGNELLVGEGWICENEDGLLTSHVDTHDGRGGNIATGKTATLHVLGGALRADLNRDGAIGADETASTAMPLRVWLNNDDDSGAVQEDSVKDAPGEGSPDSGDNVVDGLSDLVDFFPVHVAFSEALETIYGISGIDSSKVEVRLSCDGATLGCVETGFDADEAGKHLSDPDAGVESAAVGHVGGGGTNLTQNFISAMRQDSDKGVVLLEGKSRSAEGTAATLTAEIIYDGDCVLSASLPVLVAPINEFMRWYNNRAVCNGAVSHVTDTDIPSAFPDTKSDGKNVVFIHGFNVNESEAQGWSAEMFKRLWQSGCNSKFHAVAWCGDEGWPNGMYYHDDVENAFATAPTFASQFSSLSGETTVIAHSLGNMVASSAIQDHGFRPDHYFMLNAAVPVEAFDANFAADYSISNSLVHPDWYDYDSSTWSARWHELFSSGDDRAKLTWQGRFAGVANLTSLYNFHSGTYAQAGDEVLQIKPIPPSMLSDLHYEFPWTLDKRHYSWHKQEMGKGRLTLANPFIAGTTWAGWGFHTTNTWIQVGEQIVAVPFPIEASIANNMTDSELQTYPVFRHSPTNLFSSTISSNTVATILACGIPALSGPAGSREVYGLQNRNMNNENRPWGRNSNNYGKRWLHSDIKDMAFPFTFHMFRQIREDMNGNE